MDKNLTDLMLRLTSDALRGMGGAQKALSSLAELPARPDALIEWAREHMPAAADLTQSKLLGSQIEEWFKTIGFVPRTRYVELLERYEDLRRQLEEAEEMKKTLQKAIGPQHAAAQILDAFGSTLEATLNAQSEFLKRFTGGKEATDPDES